LERDRYRCQYCGLDGLTSFENSLIMSVDFIQPRARKGKKEPENLVTLVGHVIGSKAVEFLPTLKTLGITLSSAGRHYGVNGRLPRINYVVDPPKLRSLEIKQSDLGPIARRGIRGAKLHSCRAIWLDRNRRIRGIKRSMTDRIPDQIPRRHAALLVVNSESPEPLVTRRACLPPSASV